MTVSVRHGAGDRKTRRPDRSAPSRRASLAAADFRAAVVEHVVHTCAKEVRDASALDFYHALAHTVRDRLVHRWLATQRTYFERDVKRAYYLSSEFLTGRSLGLCLLNLGLYERRRALAAERGFDLGADPRARGRSRASATAASGAWRPASWTRWRRWSCPRSATASATTSACSSSGSRTAGRSSTTTTGCSSATPGSCRATRTRRPCASAAASTCATTTTGALRADWVDTRTVIGLPYDSFIVGHRTDTVNTLRLWAARATRDFDLQFFNEGDYRRAVEEKIDTENISKVLYPNDQSDEGKALRLKQQYFFVACSIADIVRQLQAAAHDVRRCSPTRSRSSSTTRTRRSPSPS